MYQAPNHRARNPVVSVYLASQERRMFSICVPPSRDWDEFKDSIRRKFELEDSTQLELFREVMNEETIEDDFALHPVDFDRHPDMQFIRHGTIFCVSTTQGVADSTESDGSSESDEVAEDEEDDTTFNFDLFGRFDIARSKSKPIGFTVQQRSMQQIWKQIRHCTAVAQHIDDTWTEFSISPGTSPLDQKNEEVNEEVVHHFRCRRMIMPYNVQGHPVGEAFEYGFENMLVWRWCVILCHGGRFSCGIFEGEREIVHRTFSRYVRRSKQGKRQVNHLSLGNKSSSAGGQKREANEKKLHLDIIGTLQEWQQEISSCDVILLHAPGPVNEKSIFGSRKEQAALYGGRGVTSDSIREKLDECWKNRHKLGFRLNRNDPRLKHITITTHRPKFSEVKRVHRFYSGCALLE